MNEILKQSTKILFGERCKNCRDLGVTCERVGLLTWLWTHGLPGDVVITLGGRDVLRTTKPIKNCPANVGEESNEAVVSAIVDAVDRNTTWISLSRFGNDV